MWVRTVVAAVGIAALVAIGLVIGRATGPQPPVAPPPTLLHADNDTDDGPPVAGTREATGRNGGASLHVVVTPANGWLGIEVESATVPSGTRCRLFAYDHAGKGYEAGGWVQSATPDFPIYGAVLLAPADLASVAVVDDRGAKVVSAEIPPA
ncbi:hypothetical protein [Kutzneria kofuensis]|uniref:Uncharacterized protein n=1 Tax=Kutzneria kofuensis TaxID=103725 RepID=A0A7W9NIV1_9PSEU|nr:hypothetical protein [Kutzneria kofuensis]MBB5894997.1 hypothetical protein [Kutzneria kofuensis]